MHIAGYVVLKCVALSSGRGCKVAANTLVLIPKIPVKVIRSGIILTRTYFAQRDFFE